MDKMNNRSFFPVTKCKKALGISKGLCIKINQRVEALKKIINECKTEDTVVNLIET